MDIKIVSSLAKVFPDEIASGYEIDSINCLKNERTSFQIVVCPDTDGEYFVKSDNKHIKLFYVKDVPAKFTVFKKHDNYFLRDAKPGNYPDILIPLKEPVKCKKGENASFWAEFSPNGDSENQIINLTVTNGDIEETVTVKAEIINKELPSQTLICTHWFHSDCLAAYYKIDVFSDEYWRIVKNFMADAVRHGINTILTPIFTPPLDTAFGGERPTVQLIDVKKHGNTYTFSFEKLEKWIDIATECGMTHFEISHLFTQWGARHAPKIMAQTYSGKYRKIFGWSTIATGHRYTDFLRQLAPELKSFIEKKGLHNKVLFHTSDEPSLNKYFSYKRAAEIVKELFGEYKIIDALSESIFFKKGIIENPVTNIERIKKFAGDVPELWTYYCCGPYNDNNPNRFNAMPSLRSRILGFIMYKYDVKGFLHWGYNFYFTRYSRRIVNPFEETDAGGEFPSGDSYVVYPSEDGTPYESLRLKVFYDAVQDFEALRLLEKSMKREDIIAMLEQGLDKPLDECNYPHSEQWLIEKRRQINNMLIVAMNLDNPRE